MLGFAVGTFGTLVGAGGGFILVPVLLFLYPDKDPEKITAISLFVVWANATSGSFAYGYHRRIDFRSGLWFALATLPGAIAGAIVVGFIPRRTFDGIFAAVLTGIGLYLLLRHNSNAIHPPATGWSVVRRRITDRSGNNYFYSFQMWKGIATSSIIGFVSSLLGIGGGVMHVPVMATVLHFPVHIAAATSQFVLAFMALEGTAVHVSTGALSWDRSLGQAGLLAVGAVFGAQSGAWLSRRLHGGYIIRALAVALVIVGFRLALKAIQG
ncbi:sulfite exporter TauE/SafE family protein [Candidatus Amarobacter glycogenicus]|uniref:sulfite exporter TauE/SafE family protein n=1 Tax=Candidatus Amarobacter glycogenicus TaxID=3140699 RepID=UPI0031CCD986